MTQRKPPKPSGFATLAVEDRVEGPKGWLRIPKEVWRYLDDPTRVYVARHNDRIRIWANASVLPYKIFDVTRSKRIYPGYRTTLQLAGRTAFGKWSVPLEAGSEPPILTEGDQALALAEEVLSEELADLLKAQANSKLDKNEIFDLAWEIKKNISNMMEADEAREKLRDAYMIKFGAKGIS